MIISDKALVVTESIYILRDVVLFFFAHRFLHVKRNSQIIIWIIDAILFMWISLGNM